MSNRINPFIVLAALLSLFSATSFAQKGKAKPVKKSVSPQSADSLKPEGEYSGTAFFYGVGVKFVETFSFSGPDLNVLMRQVDSASNGTNVVIDNLKFISQAGETTFIKKIPYQFNRERDTAKFTSQSLQTVNKLKAYDFVSGTIYFSGAGFRNVISVNANEKTSLYQCYGVSRPGTTITLDNCVYRNTKGRLSAPLNQSIKLE